jgi:hypothetical protein
MSVSYPSSIHRLLYIESTSSHIPKCFPLSPLEQLCRMTMYSRPQMPLPNALRKTSCRMVLFCQIRLTCQSLPCTNFWCSHSRLQDQCLVMTKRDRGSGEGVEDLISNFGNDHDNDEASFSESHCLFTCSIDGS